MTDKVIKVKIDAGDSKAQIDSLDKSMVQLGTAADKTTAEIGQLNQVNTQTTKTAQAVSQALGTNSNALGDIGRKAGMAGMQIQQFVGQVTAGTSPLVALSQQASDLGFVLGFPLLGAVVGIAAAVGGPLISSFINAGESSDDLKKKLDDLQKSLQDLDAESKKAFTQVELGKLSTEYEKQQDKVTKLRLESEKLTKELLESSGPAQDRLAVRLNAVGAELLKAQAEMKSYADQMNNTSKVINESLVDGQNDAVDKTASLTQQLELQRIELTQGELAARLLAAAFSTQADSVDELDPKIKQLITDNYNLEQQQKATSLSSAELTKEITEQANADLKEIEAEKRRAERAKRDQERIDQRIANIRLETQTLASEAVLQQSVRDGLFSQEEASLAAQTSARLLAASSEYQQLMEMDNINKEQKLQAEIAFQDQIAAINQQYDEAKLQMKQQMWSRELNAQQSAANAGIQLVAAFGSKSFQAQKNAAIATSLVNIAGGVAQALNNPYPANLGFAAQVAAEGAALISTIKSTNISGGGSSASISSASATLPTTPQAAPTVGAFEITGLAGLQEQLDRLDNNEVLPVSFTKRLVASLESVQRLQGA
jgi:hypothetical protein